MTSVLVLWCVWRRFRPGREGRTWEGALWGALLLVDVGTIVWPLVQVLDEAVIYQASPCVHVLSAGGPGRGRVLDCGKRGPEAYSLLGLGAPLALVYRVEATTGYNTLDVLRFKEYLQLIADEDKPLPPLSPPYTLPVIDDFPVKNRPLLDLLGVRYVTRPDTPEGEKAEWRLPDPDSWQPVCTDPRPTAYLFNAGGLREMPPYTVLENRRVMPRAFVVGEARPLPERPRTLDAMKTTDFRRTVLLEDWDPAAGGPEGADEFREASVKEYTPNRVVVETEGRGGWLVLADIWYPGWTCSIDGERVPVRRADFLFRAVPVTEGKHEIVFTFEPESYRRGRIISLAALGVVGVVLAGAGLLRLRRQTRG
jgi:hypothetical protein